MLARAGSTRAQTWETSQRPRGSPLTVDFYVFFFTAGLLATEAPGHPLFPVSKRGPADSTEALGASEELPHHVKVASQSGEEAEILFFFCYPEEMHLRIPAEGIGRLCGTHPI